MAPPAKPASAMKKSWRRSIDALIETCSLPAARPHQQRASS
jgi:hypothetical protein